MDAPTTHRHAVQPAAAPQMEIGRAWPLGSTVDGDGVNFAVFSAHAQAVEVCLFDDAGQREIARLPLPGHSGDVFHGRLPQARAGLVYGLRAHGPWRPDRGHRFNPNKLLLDPYAREVVGRFEWRDEHFGADLKHPTHRDMSDNAAHALKARVVDEPTRIKKVAHPHTPLAETVLYEVHVKGFSNLNPAVPEALRGTYAGLAHDASIAHFKRLGVTALSLLPVHHRLDEERLSRMGLSNYWGYNTLAFFCPEPRLAAGAEGTLRDEFRTMVDALHDAGLEVILDVVFNHTAESDELGPTLSFRGLDNASYYRLDHASKALYENHSGCGNTLDIRHPRVLQLVMDSLRYWVDTMGVDGFRFDLATVLGRGDHGFDQGGAFFTAVAQDPLLSRVKMIAEPWDIGPGGYQLGGFPRGWLEWNDKFRDASRGFWLTRETTRGDWAQRLCASSDVYEARGRGPCESINYGVSHDGFTLRDLVSYEHKHNRANGEHNRDGHGHNLSVNGGVEGPTDDAAINALRGRLQRVMLATVLLSQGTPMLCAGDELGHSQRGNNNPYCQDNETTWIDWAQADEALVAFTTRVLALRRIAQPLANRWYTGIADAHGLHDLTWLRGDGWPLEGDDWRDPSSRVLGCLIGKPGRARTPLLMLANGDPVDRDFLLPAGVWQACLDTTDPRGHSTWHGQGETLFKLQAHSIVVMAVAGAGLELH